MMIVKNILLIVFVLITSFILVTILFSSQKTNKISSISQDVIVQNFKEAISLPLPKSKWSLVYLETSFEEFPLKRVHLVDNNTSQYGFASYPLKNIHTDKNLSISINIKKNTHSQNVVLLRIQYSNGVENNCALDTMSGKIMVWGSQKEKPTGNIKDLGSNWFLTCKTRVPKDHKGEALLRIFPGIGATEHQQSPQATGKQEIAQIFLEH